jgi:uncharacterized membrane protein YjfL (UPF0719 family)
MEMKLLAIVEGAAYVVVVFMWMWLAKWVADRRIRTKFDPDQEIEESANLAVALRRGGLYLGLAIGLQGALWGYEDVPFSEEIVTLLWEGAVLTVFLFVALRLSDAVVIHGIDNDEAVRSGNVAVGLVEMGISIATGLIGYASFLGVGGGIASGLIFFVLGQGALILIAIAYEKMTPYSVIEEIRAGNAAAGLMLAGMLVAYGLILWSSIAGPSLGWGEDLANFVASIAMGMFLLIVLQWPIDRLFLPGTTLREEIEQNQNYAAITVAVAVKIALALVISSVVI